MNLYIHKNILYVEVTKKIETTKLINKIFTIINLYKIKNIKLDIDNNNLKNEIIKIFSTNISII